MAKREDGSRRATETSSVLAHMSYGDRGRTIETEIQIFQISSTTTKKYACYTKGWYKRLSTQLYLANSSFSF